MKNSNLLFRRQYLLGPRYANIFPSANKIQVSDTFFLTAHPDLEVTRVEQSNNFLLLLGYMLDPFNPAANNATILQAIVRSMETIDDIFPAVAGMGGRYILIVRWGSAFRIFSDPTGLRQIFYNAQSLKGVWCGSQPHTVAQYADCVFDEDLRHQLNALPLFSQSTEYWYPGNLTAFQQVNHLPPNHYLNLVTGETRRYWPIAPMPRMSLSEAVEKSAPILQGLIASAVLRFRCALGVTAGLDSRALIAASTAKRDLIQYFTHTHQDMRPDHPDIRISAAIMRQLGVEHHIVKCQPTMPPDIAEIYESSVFRPRYSKVLNAQGIFDYFGAKDQEFAVVNGNVSEIARTYYGRLPFAVKLSGRSLAVLTQMPGCTAAIDQYGAWLDSARNCFTYGIEALDLFYWEQRIGNWAAMTFSEYDIFFETVCPFNCRRLLENMLAVDVEYRSPPQYPLYTALIHAMWPQALEQPINPHDEGLVGDIKSRLRQTGVIRLLRYLRWARVG